ncbi:MAG: response regulator, partial [Methylococcales bacterium]|nr:response regulator [Methylococcales bacterium]
MNEINKAQPLVLIVEDEIKLAKVLSEYLSALGYNNHSLENGLDVLPWIKNNAPDLMLLDLML